MLEPVLRRIDDGIEGSIERWSELLRIPSVSTDPAYADDARRAAAWLVEALQGLDFEAGIRETDGHPAVIAHHPGPGGDAPHLLYYGHYDVQPPDPVELWDSGPFEPTLVDGPHGRRMVARGAVDDKGQLMMCSAKVVMSPLNKVEVSPGVMRGGERDGGGSNNELSGGRPAGGGAAGG